MEKEDFCRIVDAIQTLTDKRIEMAEKLSEVFTNASSASLLVDVDEEFTSTIIEYLKKEMNDRCGWIEHYLWELDFGRENYRSPVRDVDNETIIPLATSEDLYNLLTTLCTPLL